MTKLDAVNEIMLKVGLRPVSTLDTNGASTHAQVERVLDAEELRIQIEGWHYNTRVAELTPSASTSKITVPTGTLEIDSHGPDDHRDVAQIGDVLFDLDENTNEFDGPIECRYVLRIDFTCIPPPVREYIVCSAAARFNEQFGSRDRQFYLAQEADRAKIRAKRFNNRVADVNVLDTPEMRKVKGNRTRYYRDTGEG